MKIATWGSRHFGGQVNRIDEGFVALGHELTPHSHEASLIYSNDPGAFDQILIDRCRGSLHGKIIFNVLDLPLHIQNFDYAKLKRQLVQADAVTSISEYVQWQCREYLGLETHVIYQPIKPVFPTGSKRYPHKFMFCGRVNDPMKRCALGAAGIALAGYKGADVITVGSEAPSYGGEYWGVASDTTLNEIYNSCEFLVFPSAFEGLGLPPIEMVFAGGIPIVCNDCPTMMEWFGAVERYRKLDHTPESIASFIKEMDDPEARWDLKQQLRHLLDHSFRDKFEQKRVAQRILDVYRDMV